VARTNPRRACDFGGQLRSSFCLGGCQCLHLQYGWYRGCARWARGILASGCPHSRVGLMSFRSCGASSLAKDAKGRATITLVGLGQPHVVSVEARCPRATDRRTYWVLSALAGGFPPRMETVAFSSSVITNWSCSVQCNWIDLNLSFRAQVFAGVYNTPICNLHINDRNGHHDFPSLSTTAAYAAANLPDLGHDGCCSLVPGEQRRR
jgi:hypothetical protein